MNKIMPFMIVLVCLISCGQGTTETAQPITITVKSSTGFTKNVLNAETQQLMSAETMNYETGAKINREYTYNRSGEPASVIVEDQALGSYIITYSDYIGEPSRTARSSEEPSSNVKVRRITRTKSEGRGAGEQTTYLEYHYNDDGTVQVISKIDERNNIFIKGDTK